MTTKGMAAVMIVLLNVAFVLQPVLGDGYCPPPPRRSGGRYQPPKHGGGGVGGGGGGGGGGGSHAPPPTFVPQPHGDGGGGKPKPTPSPPTATPLPPSCGGGGGKPTPSPPTGTPSPPSGGGGGSPSCPINVLKLDACVDVLSGLVSVTIGGQASDQCCPLIQGLADLDAAVCLCTALRAKVLNLDIFLPIALNLLITCGKKALSEFNCPPGTEAGFSKSGVIVKIKVVVNVKSNVNVNVKL